METKNFDDVTNEVTNNDENVERNENSETNVNEVLTPEQEKAVAILRAKLPKLTAAGLNFEKRTGNFFRATLVKEVETLEDGSERLDKKGRPVYKLDENGNPIERVRRLVVDLDNDPAAVECADEIEIKRAAALVLDAELTKLKLNKDISKADVALRAAHYAYDNFVDSFKECKNIVENFEIPEKKVRLAVTAKLAKVEDENAKLRALLLKAGINPDEF